MACVSRCSARWITNVINQVANVAMACQSSSPSIEEMRGYIASEHVKWGALVKQLGLEGSQ